MIFLLPRLTFFSNTMPNVSMANTRIIIESIRLPRTVSVKLSISFSVKPFIWMIFICLTTVDFPDSPVPNSKILKEIIGSINHFTLSPFYRDLHIFFDFWILSLKYGSEEKGPSLCKCSILQGFFMSKKLERLRSELLSEDKITNLLGFLTK